MLWGYFLVGLLITWAVTGMLGLYLKSRTPWNRYWALFILVAMAAWMGAFFVIPLGLMYWTIYLLLFMFVAIAFGFMISAAAQQNPQEPMMTREELEGPAATRKAVGISIGVVLAVLVIMIGSRYLYEFAV